MCVCVCVCVGALNVWFCSHACMRQFSGRGLGPSPEGYMLKCPPVIQFLGLYQIYDCWGSKSRQLWNGGMDVVVWWRKIERAEVEKERSESREGECGMVEAKVGMGSGLIKAGMKGGRHGGSRCGAERSRSAESTTSQEGWHLSSEHRRIKTKMKLKMSQQEY